MYGSPVSPDKLEDVVMPDGRIAKAIRPAVPTGWDFELRRFVRHEAEQAVVCAGLLGRMAIVRALGHPTHHPELSRMQQCHGWIYDTDASGQLIGMPYENATQEIHDAVRRKGASLRAWVYDLGEPVTPFTRLPSQIHQYRSFEPIEIEPKDAYEITGLDWPPNIAIMKPYDH